MVMTPSGSFYRVQRSQFGVVPLGNLAQEHFCQHRRSRKSPLAKPSVEHGHGTADDGGELHHAVFIEFFAFDGRIGGTESHRLGTNLAMPPEDPMDWWISGPRPLRPCKPGPPRHKSGTGRLRAGSGDVGSQGRGAKSESSHCSGNGFEEQAFRRRTFQSMNKMAVTLGSFVTAM